MWRLKIESAMLNVKNSVPFHELEQLLAQKTGLRIPDDGYDRFIAMMHEHAARRGYSALEDYQNFLAQKNPVEEWEELVRALISGETFFFRDHGQFDLMRMRLLPKLIEQHRGDNTLRLWSAGCASGEEAYSLAMLVDMLLPERSGWNILILGTDIDSAAIARAQRGRYGQWSFRMVPPEIQQRYFHAEGGEWALKDSIRRMVTFQVSNLVVNPFPNFDSELHGMDMILCRNVFIYFDPAAISAVAAKFAATLCEGGYLLTAHTELIGHPVPGLKSKLFAEGVAYQRASCHAVVAPPVMQAAVSVDSKTLRVPAAPVPIARNDEILLKDARAHAGRGDFDLAEQECRAVLDDYPIAAAPYFLLAQLAQVKGDFELAREWLNKAIYLDSHFVAAYLELAALCERAGDLPRAQTLRHIALGIVRSMPAGGVLEQYEATAGELAQWLAQWEHEATYAI